VGARLKGKVAIVTGGANGIGRACCERFSEEGAAVVVADLLEEPGIATVEHLRGAGGQAEFVPLDAVDADANDALAARAVEFFGHLDVLVTAAGISHAGYRSGDRDADARMLATAAESLANPARALTELGIDEWQRVIDVNLTGTFLAVRAAARVKVDAGRGGSIVTIASIAAKHPEAGPASYAVSKAGVWMLTKHAARSLGSSGIRVNAIGPGFIETNMTRILGDLPAAREALLTAVPLGRIGLPREVADTAVFLASDEASYHTGEILHPDGGFYTD
jgi:NAD(P)-dependent dehydrogenase (short-subunit alcohol dehydrogenase family)